jgi:hypothetical protein
MGCRSLLTAAALVATLGVTAPPVLAQQASSDRVLAQPDSGFNPSAVRGMISRGDAAAARGDLAALVPNTTKHGKCRNSCCRSTEI